MNVEFCTDCGISFAETEARHAVREGGNICGKCADRRRGAVTTKEEPAAAVKPACPESKSETITDYATVPWYRRNWFALLSFIFMAPVFAVIAFTGDIYYQKRGAVVRNHPAIRVIAGLLAVLWTVTAVTSDKPGFEMGNVLSLLPSTTKARTVRSAGNARVAADALTVSPIALVSAYVENEIAADQRFKGKRLRIGGPIADIGRDILDNAYITFASADALREVQVFFDEDLEGRVASLRRGQSVTVTGTCKGLMMHVLIDDARFE